MPPHIVLMVVDDVGWGSVGFAGSPSPDVQTPAIDELASEGCRLPWFYSAPRCSPARASLLTGRHAWRHAGWMTNSGFWRRRGGP